MKCLVCTDDFGDSKPLHGLHQSCFYKIFDVQPQNFTDLFERTSQSGPKATSDTTFKRFNSSFFHGRYRKYSGTLGGKNYIIKVQQSEFPELPAVEYISNQIARSIGLSVPDFHFIYFENQAYAFLSRNIMDLHTPATLDHIYKFLKNESEFDCQHLSAIIQKETGRLAEVHRFVELCLFDALIGNNDRHGRNLAFITKSGGARILSPFYDNPSYIGIADPVILGTDLQPRGTIYTSKTQEPRLADYAAEFKALGFESAVVRFRNRTLSKSHQIFGIVRDAKTISERRKASFINLIDKRIQELENV